jgi:hypothetical protein
MSTAHWTQRQRWNGPRGVPKASGERPRRKRLVDMSPEQRAAHEVRTAQERARKAEALAAMGDDQLEAYEAARRAEKAARDSVRARRRASARALLDAHVDALRAPGDLPLADREPLVPQTEATMRGILLADVTRPNGARRLVLLREWDGQLRILRTLAFVENGRPVRSRGDTIYLREVPPDGELVQSLRELDAEIEALTYLRARLARNDPDLAVQIASMREAREQWQRESAAAGTRSAQGAGNEGAPQ